MIIMASVSDLIKIVTTGATEALDVHASWIDDNAGTITPGRTNTAIAAAGTNTVVGSPAASTFRNVKAMTIANKNVSASIVVTVQHYDGTTTVNLITYTILAGETLMYFDTDGWVVMDASGGIKTAAAAGRLLAKSVLTSSTTFTTGPQTTMLRVRMVGGGGGGGGATSNAGNISCAGGGSSGGYAEKTFTVSPNTAYTYQIGAGGAGGINGANAGNQGTNTFFVVGATNVVANGGPGGAAAPAAGAPTTRLGGALPSQSTGGDVLGSGMAGGAGQSFNLTSGVQGSGGTSALGGGAQGIVAVNGNGAAGVNYGSGGAGGSTVGAANQNGGAGANGVIIVEEYS